MTLLAPKLILTPLLVGAASIAERRFGPLVSGLLVGLPLTSGPIVLFVAIEGGPELALSTIDGALAGAIGQAAFVTAYARMATRGGPVAAVALGGLAFALVGAAMPVAGSPLLAALGLVAVAVALRLLPCAPASTVSRRRLPAWDVPARIAVATGLVVTITTVAPLIGGRWSGILGTFPVYALILATFAHREGGPARSTAVLRGLLYGLVGFEAFFLTLSLVLPVGLAPAFLVATIAAIVTQVLVLNRLLVLRI